MVSGSQDFTRPLETTIRPKFEALGTRESEKKLALFPVGHLPPKNDLVRESFIWLDAIPGHGPAGAVTGTSVSTGTRDDSADLARAEPTLPS
jgi:hypothetical protein